MNESRFFLFFFFLFLSIAGISWNQYQKDQRLITEQMRSTIINMGKRAPTGIFDYRIQPGNFTRQSMISGRGFLDTSGIRTSLPFVSIRDIFQRDSHRYLRLSYRKRKIKRVRGGDCWHQLRSDIYFAYIFSDCEPRRFINFMQFYARDIKRWFIFTKVSCVSHFSHGR